MAISVLRGHIFTQKKERTAGVESYTLNDIELIMFTLVESTTASIYELALSSYLVV